MREKTTWLGIVGILTAFAILPFDEQVSGYIATFLTSFGGLIGILWQEKPKGKKDKKKKPTTATVQKTEKPKTAKLDTKTDDDDECAKINLH